MTSCCRYMIFKCANLLVSFNDHTVFGQAEFSQWLNATVVLFLVT